MLTMTHYLLDYRTNDLGNRIAHIWMPVSANVVGINLVTTFDEETEKYVTYPYVAALVNPKSKPYETRSYLVLKGGEEYYGEEYVDDSYNLYYIGSYIMNNEPHYVWFILEPIPF